MAAASDSALETARERVREAKEKFDRQQRRYAMLAIEGEASAKAARTLMEQLEAELEASQEALRKLEEENHGG
jgi:hypothetical protein